MCLSLVRPKLHLIPLLARVPARQVDPSRREFAKKAIGREEAERVLEQVRLQCCNSTTLYHGYLHVYAYL